MVHNNGSVSHNHGFNIQGSHILIDHAQSYANNGMGIQIYLSGGVNGASLRCAPSLQAR